MARAGFFSPLSCARSFFARFSCGFMRESSCENIEVAERVGFEPTVLSPVRRFSSAKKYNNQQLVPTLCRTTISDLARFYHCRMLAIIGGAVPETSQKRAYRRLQPRRCDVTAVTSAVPNAGHSSRSRSWVICHICLNDQQATSSVPHNSNQAGAALSRIFQTRIGINLPA